MAFKMAGYSAFDKEDPKTMRVKVASVQPDGGALMVNTPDGIRKVSGGAAGIAEVKEGQMVTVNVGGAGKLTLAAKDTDDELTGGPRKGKTVPMKNYKKGYYGVK